MGTLRKLLTAGLIVSSQLALAQEENQALEQLKAPSMPAATIISAQVNEVSRPNSLKAFEAALLNNYLDSVKGLTLPNSFAMEFNPYMLSDRPNFSYEQYIEGDSWEHLGKNFGRNLSISVASTTNFVVNDSVSTHAMGFGIRTMLLRGKVSESLKDAYQEALKSNLDAIGIKTNVNSLIFQFEDDPALAPTYTLATLRTYVLDGLENIDLLKRRHLVLVAQNAVIEMFKYIPEDTPLAEVVDAFEKAYDIHRSEGRLTALRELLEEVKTERYGWRWEIDYAQGLSFPDNNFSSAISPRWGIWTNLSYRPQKSGDHPSGIPSNFELIALARILQINSAFLQHYQEEDPQLRVGTNYDFGLRFVFEYKKFSAELEGVYRLNRKKILRVIDGEEFFKWQNDNTEKYVLNINYSINKDVVVSFNFGKNYDTITSTRGNLISGLTVNFGFGGYSVEELLKSAQ